ncbi:MAG: DUF547 domain-containing protein [Burkholderiales bacterium]
MEARLIAFALALAAAAPAARAFDHSAWDALLKKHVVVLREGHASQVRYDGFAADHAALKTYLDALSRVGAAEFDAWPRDERKAFLINAYNAFTVQKILTRWPDIASIWDFGKLFGNPFKDDFFRLFGSPMTLDGIEHGMLRKKGAYDDPRVHFAVNCASVGCPMLREEAYVAVRLDAQLDEQARRFLGDATRNRYRDGRLEVSKIFDWFKEDFAPLPRYFAHYATMLGYPGGEVPVTFLDYDWSLNAYRSSSPR